jgi:hypothetical protein
VGERLGPFVENGNGIVETQKSMRRNS